MSRFQFFLCGAALLLCGCESAQLFRSSERAQHQGAFTLDAAAAGHVVQVAEFSVAGNTGALCLGAEGDLRNSRWYAGARGCAEDGVVSGSQTHRANGLGETASVRLEARSEAVASAGVHVGYRIDSRLSVEATYGLAAADFTLSGQVCVDSHCVGDSTNGMALGHTLGVGLVYQLTRRSRVSLGHACTEYQGVDDKSLIGFPFRIRARQQTCGFRLGFTHTF